MLDYLSPRLLETLRSFHPPSRKSTEVLAAGKLQSSFAATGAAAAEKPTQVLHEEWKKIIEEFSTAMVSRRARTDSHRAVLSPLPLCCADVNNY